MKILKIIGIIIVIAIFGLVAWVNSLPAEVHLERSITVNKDISTVYADVMVIKNFNSWSPWAKIDPETKYSYEGPEQGVDAKLIWASDHSDVGNGSMWITDANGNSKISMRMDFGMGGEPYANYLFEEVDGGTKVTWTYDQVDLGLMAKFFLRDIENMLGSMYEDGMANFKSYIEEKAAVGPAMEEEIVENDSTMVEADSLKAVD